MESWHELVPKSLLSKYEMHNFNNAVEILAKSYKAEYAEINLALERFSFNKSDILKGGGNESAIPKIFKSILEPKGWQEVKITGDLIVKLHRRNPTQVTQLEINNYIDGHNIDYVKGKVAIDLEWNSKDQTFDRDLYAFRTFYECGIIDCGVIITRSEELNPVFTQLGIKNKFGASTTWIGKLIPRINSRRHGGCPLLVIGIKSTAIVDLEGK